MEQNPSPQILTALLRLLDAQGWDGTTVDELAREAGMSRATFFRTFGGKEDVVFADHAETLPRLEDFLTTTDHDTASALREGLLLVFRHHLEDADRTLARHRLLRQSQALRNRELLTSHRYEAVFRHWLADRLVTAGALGDAAAVGPLSAALAGACVALHNSYLRRWLREQHDGLQEEFSTQAGQLIRVMLEGYREPADAAEAPAQRPVAVVTMVGQHADTEEIVDAVRKALS